MELLDEVQSQGHAIPQWSLGGGTVLMFHYQHRLSKDIDIFITDPQFLRIHQPQAGRPRRAINHRVPRSLSFYEALFT